MWLEGCHNPYKMEQSWECTFLKLFAHRKTILGRKKNHHWTSKLQASINGQSDPSRLNWPCTLNDSFKVQWWNLFLMLILYSYGKEFQKSTLPTLFHFLRVRATLQTHVTTTARTFSLKYKQNLSQMASLLSTFSPKNVKQMMCISFESPKIDLCRICEKYACYHLEGVTNPEMMLKKIITGSRSSTLGLSNNL